MALYSKLRSKRGGKLPDRKRFVSAPGRREPARRQPWQQQKQIALMITAAMRAAAESRRG